MSAFIGFLSAFLIYECRLLSAFYRLLQHTKADDFSAIYRLFGGFYRLFIGLN